MVAYSDGSFVFELLEDFDRIHYVQTGLISVIIASEVLADSEYFGHLTEREVKLVHFFIPLFKAFKQMFNLKVNSLLLLVCTRVLFEVFY